MTRRGWLGWVALGGGGWWSGDVFEAAAKCPLRRRARQQAANGFAGGFPFLGDVEAVAATGGWFRERGSALPPEKRTTTWHYDYVAAGS